MKFLCTKVRPCTAAYADVDGHSTPSRGWDVHLMAAASEHPPGMILEAKLIVLGGVTRFTEGEFYDLPLDDG